MRLLLSVLLCSVSVFGAVTGHEVIERSDVLSGRSFGKSGPYERLNLKLRYAIDPQNPANAIVSDIGYAPRNEKGLVEFSADVYILKPTNPANGNGTLLVDVPNRGRKLALHMIGLGERSHDPKAEADFGDFYLLEEGYTLVWVGWQWDVPHTPGLMRLYPPVAKDGETPIRGLARAEFVPESTGRSFNLADRDHQAYPVADPDDPTLRLTVRSSVDGQRTVIPRDKWSFAREENGRPVPDRTQVFLKAGYEPGLIYELVYPVENPVVVGLGPIAIRDVVSMIKNGAPGSGLRPMGDVAARKQIKRAIAFGVSQTGRFLRTFLYHGFNRDEQNRQVFDGMMVHVAGGGRGSFNHRFAQPSRDGHPFVNSFYPSDIYPFADLPLRDPETGLSQGLLDKAREHEVVPKIFYTNTSYEYWGRVASLIHTTPDGAADAPLPDSTRIYFLAGAQHGAGSFPPEKNRTEHYSNTNDYRYILRGLLDAMNDWIADGQEPPPSRYPRLDNGTLVTLDKLSFPKIPGVRTPQRPKYAWRVDYGPDFTSKGIVTKEPPELGKRFPTLVPQVDKDGNELAGVRLPTVDVPLATLTGWNLRAASAGSPQEIYSMVGSWFPLPAKAGSPDPRTPLSERYKSKEDYLAKVRGSAERLAAQDYILERDIDRITKRAAAEWDYLKQRPNLSSQSR